MIIKLFLEFLKVGCLIIGGGYGGIPIIKEVVINNGWVNETEFTDMLAIAESTPGPLAVNMATYVGSIKAGIPGALIATLGVIIPAFLIMIIVAVTLPILMKNDVINNVFSRVRPSAVALIFATGILLILSNAFGVSNIYSRFSINDRVIYIIILFVLLAVMVIYRLIKKKSIGTIPFIVISFIVGVILNLIL